MNKFTVTITGELGELNTAQMLNAIVHQLEQGITDNKINAEGMECVSKMEVVK